eukprot:TRINITY_DN3977_c0_g1_i27.p1 TRINITY_DN3977_c0_g1~~TRINITY_DN3977_c0_g1_i27.p1  ORF type:complete len:126 (-),score=37.51 TRINITY_DN3977_c0_g1_i27:62-439(-)
MFCFVFFFFFFQAEDGIRDVERSRGLGDVYKRQVSTQSTWEIKMKIFAALLMLLASCLVFASRDTEVDYDMEEESGSFKWYCPAAGGKYHAAKWICNVMCYPGKCYKKQQFLQPLTFLNMGIDLS